MARVTLLTDFGLQDTFVGVMKGVIEGISPGTTVVDLSHQVPAQDVETGARMLLEAVPYFPAETVHVAVVDPGVGSKRRALAISTAKGVLVGPDNGLLYPAAQHLGLERAVILENPKYRLPVVSSTFHGRDVFAPAAAHLARGVPLDELGPDAGSIVALLLTEGVVEKHRITGRVVRIDVFGNLISDISNASLSTWNAHDNAEVLVGETRINALSSTFSDVAVDALVAYPGSSGFLEIAVREGNAASTLGAARGTPVVITRRGS